MKRVLITGSEGEVGLDLAPQLAKRFNVTGFDIKPGTHESIRSIRGDLCNYPEVAKAAAGIDAIVHMAALLPSDSAPDSFVDINVKATTNVLQAAVDCGVRRVVYCSTVWASGHGLTEPYQPIDEKVPCAPVCMYGTTKWLGELVADYYGREYGLETVIVRFAGYNYVRGYTPEGDIDWPAADVESICRRYFGYGFKLMNPVDLGTAFGNAVDIPGISGERFVVGCHTPFVAGDREALLGDPAAVAERYFPGSRDFLNKLEVELEPVQFYFDSNKAESILGFKSRHDFGDIIRMYREQVES